MIIILFRESLREKEREDCVTRSVLLFSKSFNDQFTNRQLPIGIGKLVLCSE